MEKRDEYKVSRLLEEESALPSESGHKFPWGKERLSFLLRWGGGILLVASSVAFMYQGITSFSPITRHWLMIGICILLGLLGYVTGTVMREEKGARLFFGLAAASFPVLASQLGAMFYSLFGQPPAGMPQPLVFSLTSFTMVMAIALLTLLVALSASYLAFRILARSQAGVLTLVFSLFNICLLIPLRADFVITALIILAFGVMIVVDISRLKGDYRLDSFEGRAARIILSLPVLTLIGRSFFYPMAEIFYGCMLLVFGACCAFYWGRVTENPWLRLAGQVVGLMALCAGWTSCVIEIADAVNLKAGEVSYLALVPMMVVCIVSAGLSSGGVATRYRRAAAVIGLAGIILAHLLQGTLGISAIGFVVALAILVHGILTAEKAVVALGCLGGMVVLLNVAKAAFFLGTAYSWLLLALLGIGAMLGASLLETKISLRFMRGGSLWGRLGEKECPVL